MAEQRGGDEEAGPGGRNGHTSRAEWIVAALGALLVLGVLASILQEALGEPSTPPTVEVIIESIVETRNGYLVEIEARNAGRQTAAGLVIEGVLRGDSTQIETAGITLDYLPGESHRRAGLFFENDPRDYQLRVSAKGYDLP